ncbi:MAG: hypothetical protein WC556_09230 [Candidatus Methanoperedens sp.]
MPTTTVKKLHLRVTKRLNDEILNKDAPVGFIPTTGTILMLIITAIIAGLILSWSSGITAPVLASSASVSVVRLDNNIKAVTILSIDPKEAVIKYLLFNDSLGSRSLNISSNTFIPLRNVGETSFVQASSGDIEISAVFNDSTQMVVYRGRV